MSAEPNAPDRALMRAAISEHIIANGFKENIFYLGDSSGNVFIGADTTGDALVDSVTTVSIPGVLDKEFGTLTAIAK